MGQILGREAGVERFRFDWSFKKFALGDSNRVECTSAVQRFPAATNTLFPAVQLDHAASAFNSTAYLTLVKACFLIQFGRKQRRIETGEVHCYGKLVG